MDAHDRFRAWLASTGKTQAAMGELLGGYTQPHISNLAGSRSHRPSRRLAKTIERLSTTWVDGPIRAAEWDAVEAPTRPGLARPGLAVSHVGSPMAVAGGTR